MKKRDQFPDHRNLLSGELYLFHSTNRPSPATGSLFGIIDKTSDGIIYLEASSRDYYRRASRSELRDYLFNLAWYECRMRSDPSCGRPSVARDEIGHPP